MIIGPDAGARREVSIAGGSPVNGDDVGSALENRAAMVPDVRGSGERERRLACAIAAIDLAHGKDASKLRSDSRAESIQVGARGIRDTGRGSGVGRGGLISAGTKYGSNGAERDGATHGRRVDNDSDRRREHPNLRIVTRRLPFGVSGPRCRAVSRDEKPN